MKYTSTARFLNEFLIKLVYKTRVQTMKCYNNNIAGSRDKSAEGGEVVMTIGNLLQEQQQEKKM